MNPLAFTYRFCFPDGKKQEFHIRLDAETLLMEPPAGSGFPDWTRLGFRQCPNCPLTEKESSLCPVARNLAGIIDYFARNFSYERVRVEIESPGRLYASEVPVQNAIGSLIGLIMVTSGCPVLDYLRPMARTHLPFATAEETMYRAITMYLFAQYFLYRKGKKPDWDLKHLVEVYEEIRVVNKSFVKRLSDLQIQDSSLNALVILDCFADLTTFSISTQQMGQFEKLFEAYWPDASGG